METHFEFQENSLLNRISHRLDDMALAIMLWMCSLPLVGLLVLPILGLKISLLVAVALLIIALILCRGVCSWKIFHS